MARRLDVTMDPHSESYAEAVEAANQYEAAIEREALRHGVITFRVNFQTTALNRLFEALCKGKEGENGPK